jgi:hypothetical protein
VPVTITARITSTWRSVIMYSNSGQKLSSSIGAPASPEAKLWRRATPYLIGGRGNTASPASIL